MSHANELSSTVEVDRKPFPFPVPETAVAAYGFRDGMGPSRSPPDGPSPSPFAVASSLPWRRLPQHGRSWYLDAGGPDHPDCNVRSSLDHRLPPVAGPCISPRFTSGPYGQHRTLDDASGGAAGLSQLSIGLAQSPRHDPTRPTSCYLGNTGKSLQPVCRVLRRATPFIGELPERKKTIKKQYTINTKIQSICKIVKQSLVCGLQNKL